MVQTVLIATLTQGSADAFVQASMNTGLSASSNTGYVIKQILMEFNDTLTSGGAPSRELALSRASKAAMPTLADDDVIFKSKVAARLATSGAYIEDIAKVYVPQYDIILIEDVIYWQFDSAATGVANTAIVRLVVEPVKVTTDERIAILQSRIN